MDSDSEYYEVDSVFSGHDDEDGDDVLSVGSDYSSGSTDIILADAMSLSASSDSSTDLSDEENNGRGERDRNQPTHNYPLRRRSRNGGNVAPIPPSRISITISGSDTEMESLNEDDSGEEEGDNMNNGNSPAVMNVQRPLSQSSQIEAVGENEIQVSGGENIDSGGSRRQPLTEIASLQQVQDVNSKENDGSPKPKKNRLSPDIDDHDDGMTCSVCLDNFTNSGAHRLVSLRCGHLFGNSCVERWLKSGCMGGARRCPTCNKKASLKDIRVIYAKKLQPLDTCEKDKLQLELEKVKGDKARLEVELTKVKLNCDMQKKSIESLQHQILYLETLIQNIPTGTRQNNNSLGGIGLSQFDMKHENDSILLVNTVDLSNCGCCRVLGFSPNVGLLVASQKSSISLFPGFGVRKIDSLDFRPTTFVYLHSSPIRDLAFHFQDANLLLSVSLDKTAKIFDNVSNSVVQTFKSDNLLWSCTWDVTNPHRFITGSQNGIVKVYDKRQTGESVSSHVTTGDTTPVVSLTSISPTPNSVLPQGGFLSCRLNAVYAYKGTSATSASQSQSQSQLVMLDGPFISLDYCPASQFILASTRPSSRFHSTRHMLSQLAPLGDRNFSNNIHTFTRGNSGQLMSRSCQLVAPDGDVWVAAHNESRRAVELLSVNKNDAIHTIGVTEPVLDLCPLKMNNSCLLGSLSANSLLVHKLY